ncbi:MAG: porin [Chlorobiaceae bacterium]|nr:porin [Chlorobiaceae bacterium]
MKKMLSLAAVFAVLAYASPASAELKLSGDTSARLRGQFQDTQVNDANVNLAGENDLQFAYRLRLKAAADLGDGYFFKSLITTDNNAGGWLTVDNNNEEASNIDISQLYFGRMLKDSHWMVGRIPLGSVNNPIFDLTLYPFNPADIAVATFNMDRVYALNYGCKVGSGDINATLVVFDNDSTDNSGAENDGLLNDAYAVHLTYKDKFGDVTIEPQAIIGLTNLDGGNYNDVTPNTFGANLSMPAGEAKVGVSAFYTTCNDTNFTAQNVDYSGYLLRLKGELGSAMAWIDLNSTTDKTGATDADNSNLFIWAQYNFKMHESATGSFSLTPIVRYWARSTDNNAGTKTDYSRLRTELVATVTF